MNSRSQELLPCPFCGGRSVSVHEGTTFRWVHAECDNCGAQCGEVRKQTIGEGTQEIWDSEAKVSAITEWNTRAQQPTAPGGEVEILHAALERLTRLYESEQDFENVWSLRPDWLRNALDIKPSTAKEPQ